MKILTESEIANLPPSEVWDALQRPATSIEERRLLQQRWVEVNKRDEPDPLEEIEAAIATREGELTTYTGDRSMIQAELDHLKHVRARLKGEEPPEVSIPSGRAPQVESVDGDGRYHWSDGSVTEPGR